MKTRSRSNMLPVVSQQGSLFSIAIQPQAVIDALRQDGFTPEIVGTEDDWRQLIIRPRSDASASHRLTFSLKTRDTDQVYFRRQIPAMRTLINQIPAAEPARQEELETLTSHITVCIGMTAEPGFADHQDFIEAMTLVARLLDGFFFIHAGFLDAESRELLMVNGSFDPQAVMPETPAYPASARSQDEPEHLPFDVQNDPPSARRIAERMYVMLALAYRGALELNSTRPDRSHKLSMLGDWFWSLEIGHELEDAERHFLDQPLGEMLAEEAQQLTMLFESVAVLAWAINLMPMPAHDEFAQPAVIAETLGLFREDTHFVIDSAELRNSDEIQSTADRIMAIHWRLREFELNPKPIDFAGMAKSSWFGQLDIKKVPMIDRDLAIGPTSITNADAIARKRCQLSTQWRHRAINWVSGHHPQFSQVDVST